VAGGTLVLKNEETMLKLDNLGGPFTRGIKDD